MMLTRLVFVFLLVLPAGVRCEEKADSLKTFAEQLQGRHAYGVYIRNSKIGWSVAEIKLTKHDGKEALLVSDETVFEIKRATDTVKMRSVLTTLFGLEGDGEVLWSEDIQNE